MLASAQLRWTVWVSDVTAAYKHGTVRGGEVGISETAAAAAGTPGLSKVSAGCH